MSQENYIKTELAKYNLPDAKIAEMKDKYLKLKVSDVKDVGNYVLCKEAHQKVKQLRIDIENKRKTLKASSLAFGRAVDGEAKRLSSGVSEIEAHLLTQRKIVEYEKERIIKEKERIEAERVEKLRIEEEERIFNIKKQQEEQQRKLDEEREKLQRRQEEQVRKEKEAQDKIEAEKNRNEYEKKKIEADKIKQEEDRIRLEQEMRDRIQREKEAAERAVREEKIRAEEDAKRKKEEEIEKRKEEERKALIAPDIEKIKKLAYQIGNIQYPQVKDLLAIRIVNSVREQLKIISQKLINTKI